MIDSAVGQVVLTSLTPTTFSASSASQHFQLIQLLQLFQLFYFLSQDLCQHNFSQETLVDLSSISARTDGEEDER